MGEPWVPPWLDDVQAVYANFDIPERILETDAA
jgi:hypothetical protein